MPRYIGQYELGQILGSGGFGKVYLGHDTKSKDDVAMKLIDKALIKSHHMETYVEREIAIMKRLQHPHVIKLKSIVELPNTYCLVMELAANGELFDKILESKRFAEKTARVYFQQLVSAVMYCHSKGVVHRDLKAENLLLGENGALKVCDFGLSRYTLRNGTPDSAVKFMSLAGSPDYQAPEMNNPDVDGYSGETCDVWSCGVILYFMLVGNLPFTGRDDEETTSNINRAHYKRNHQYLSEGAADLISRILTLNPKDRVTLKAIATHPWFAVDLPLDLFPDLPVASPEIQSSPVNTGISPTVPIVPGKDHCADSLVASLRRAFHSCNVDHSGHLKRSEVRDVLIALNNGNPVADEEVEGVMECFQRDEDGTITEEEFIQGWAIAEKKLGGRLPLDRLVNIFHYNLEMDLMNDLRRAFERLDVKNLGVLTAQEVMSIQELSLNETDAGALISAMDTHKAGTVTFEDFVRAVMTADLLQTHEIGSKLQRLRELFHAVDRGRFLTYLNTGFNVSGFREQIAQKLMEEGPRSPCCTAFDPGDSGTYLHGVHEDECGRRLEVGVQLLPSCTGYTKVMSYRIAGKTEVFHKWFGKFRVLLHEEIVRCVEDTSVKGQSEEM